MQHITASRSNMPKHTAGCKSAALIKTPCATLWTNLYTSLKQFQLHESYWTRFFELKWTFGRCGLTTLYYPYPVLSASYSVFHTPLLGWVHGVLIKGRFIKGLNTTLCIPLIRTCDAYILAEVVAPPAVTSGAVLLSSSAFLSLQQTYVNHYIMMYDYLSQCEYQ